MAHIEDAGMSKFTNTPELRNSVLISAIAFSFGAVAMLLLMLVPNPMHDSILPPLLGGVMVACAIGLFIEWHDLRKSK